MAFSRQEYWSGMQFPSSEDLPNPGIKLSLPHSRQILYCLSHQGRPDKTFSVKYLVGVKLMDNKRHDLGNFLVVQWLGLITLAAKGLSLIPGLGRSPGEGNGYPLQYSCLENAMDRGPFWATAYGVTKNPTRLSEFHYYYYYI